METRLLKSRFEWIWNKLARCPWSTQKADYRTRPSHLGGTIGVCTRRERHRTGKSGFCLELQKHVSFILLFPLHLIFSAFPKIMYLYYWKKKVKENTRHLKESQLHLWLCSSPRTPEAGKFFWSPACTPCQTRTFSQVQGSILLHLQPGRTQRSVSLVVLTACMHAQSYLTLWSQGL